MKPGSKKMSCSNTGTKKKKKTLGQKKKKEEEKKEKKEQQKIGSINLGPENPSFLKSNT